jgi:serine protease Do
VIRFSSIGRRLMDTVMKATTGMVTTPRWSEIASRRFLTLLLTLLTVTGATFAVKPAAALDRDNTAKAIRATVQVIVPDNSFDQASLGSGTIMNEGGLILTNHHVVDGDRPNGFMNDDGMALIAVTPTDLRGAAVIKYFGEIVKVNPELDLALIQITALVDDPRAPLPENLGLTPIRFGDADALLPGDEINIFGFPGIGGNSVTYTRGTVSGFEDADRDGIFEWIKTDATVSHGNSGGLATDELGLFVGVPTRGRVDEGGSINLVRNGNLALRFFNSYFPQPVSDGPQITRVQFAEAVNRRNQPINPGVRFASGITDLYAVFDYTGFTDGQNVTTIWYVDGFEVFRDAFPWDGGASGTSWTSIYNDDGLEDGFIELEIQYASQRLYRGGVIVGEGNGPGPDPGPGPTPDPAGASFGPIVFAADMSNDQPVNVGTSFSGIQRIYAFFDFRGMRNGMEWGSNWYLDGEQVLSDTYIWEGGQSGSTWVTLSHPQGLPPGEFRLELLIEGQVSQTNSFIVTRSQQPVVNQINVIGTVRDLDNRRQRISGALVIFLKPGVTIDQWVAGDFQDSEVHGTGTSNARGDFQLSAKVTPGEAYSIVVLHDEYKPVAGDAFRIPADAVDPYELDIEMEKK